MTQRDEKATADLTVTRIETIPIAGPERSDSLDFWVTSPVDVFDDLPRPPSRRMAPGSPTDVIVRVHTDSGIFGLGLVGLGSPASVSVIEHHLAKLVVGSNPFDVELLWEKMYRATIPIGVKGLVLEAISAIDIALWDIIGKALGQPLYNLLGGQTKTHIRVYASDLYARRDLDQLRAEAEQLVDQGFSAFKMRFGYGPADGRSGMRKNYELIETVRAAVGDDADLAADAYMGWDVSYAIAMIRMLDDLHLAWVEEPVVPTDVTGYAYIRSSVHTPIAGGEHEFTRFGYRRLLEAGAVDIVQPDVNRMGGITEARKVWALAAAYSTKVVPHSPQAHNVHLVMAQLNSDLVEWFPHNRHGSLNFYQEIFRGNPQATEGFIVPSSRPGLGIELNEETVDLCRARLL